MASLIGKPTLIEFEIQDEQGFVKEVSAMIRPTQPDWWGSVLRFGKYFDIHYSEETKKVCVYEVMKEQVLGATDNLIHTIQI